MVVLLSLSAWAALDCTNRTPATCAAVDGLTALVNAEAGTNVLRENAAVRFKPSTLYGQLEAVRHAVQTGGCRASATFDGWTGGRYDAAAGWFDGAFEEPAGDDGRVIGTVTAPARAFEGGWSVVPAESGEIGGVFARYNSIGQVASDRDASGFVMGRWIRTSGNRGVFVTLHGSCEDAADPAEAFDPWYVGDLAPPASPEGGAWAFDGVDDVVHLPLVANPEASTFTVEAWVRTTDPLGTIVELYSGSPLGADRTLYLDSGQPCFYVYTPGFSIVCGATPIDDGQWHHVAGVLGLFGQQHIVVDGIDQGSTAAAPSAFTYGTQILRVGFGYAGPLNGVQPLDGDVDDVRIWSEARSLNNVFIFRDQVLPPATPSLLGQWTFDDGTLADSTSINPVGTSVNTVPPFGPISPGAF